MSTRWRNFIFLAGILVISFYLYTVYNPVYVCNSPIPRLEIKEQQRSEYVADEDFDTYHPDNQTFRNIEALQISPFINATNKISEFVTTISRPPYAIAIWPDEYISHYIRTEGNYAATGPGEIMERLLNMATKADTLIVDVGTNIGVVTLYAAARGFRVIGFEASSDNFEKARMSIWSNGFTNSVTIYPRAVYSSTGIKLNLTMNFSKEKNLTNSGIGTLASLPPKLKNNPNSKTSTVETITLDDAIHEDIFFLKVDIEGCECHAWKGAQQLFKRYQVKYIMLEFEDDQFHDCDCTRRGIVKFFFDQGYCFYITRKYSTVHDLELTLLNKNDLMRLSYDHLILQKANCIEQHLDTY